MPFWTAASQRAGLATPPVAPVYCMWMKLSRRWSATALRSRALPTIDSGVVVVWLIQPRLVVALYASPVSSR